LRAASQPWHESGGWRATLWLFIPRSTFALSSERSKGMGMSWERSVGEELNFICGAEVIGSVDSKALSHSGEA